MLATFSCFIFCSHFGSSTESPVLEPKWLPSSAYTGDVCTEWGVMLASACDGYAGAYHSLHVLEAAVSGQESITTIYIYAYIYIYI